MQQAVILSGPLAQEMDRVVMQIAHHYGFAQVPRAVTRGKYKAASLIEKGLYACLKDICGDVGECFYTLRNLAAEICTSISTLSRYIPRLITRGLIAATKRPGKNNKHEIWHISIVNIWSENDALYKPQEIVSDGNNVTDNATTTGNVDRIVADGNNNQSESATSVADSNKEREIVSSGNKDCFYLNDRIRTLPEEESVIPKESSSESNTSSASADDALPLYEDVLKEQQSPLAGWLADITLMDEALERAKVQMTPKQKRKLVIRSISAKQRPRRPH